MKHIRNRWLIVPVLAGISAVYWTTARANPPVDQPPTQFWAQFRDQPLSLDLSTGKSIDGTLTTTVFVDGNMFLGLKTKASESTVFVNAHQISSFHKAT
jgi:hypothetical protein